MAALRPLRGGCHCGRNHYTVNLPENCAEIARVLFDTDPRHRIFQASPISAFLRVPLTWYSSTTSAFFPDEASPAIRRTYTHPSQQHTKRCFCGFCGTPLSYWSEDPPAEAEFIRLTLGSLHSEDLGDLEDLGLIPGTPPSEAETEGDGGASGSSNSRPTRFVVARETLGVPWFDSMVAGSRLGNLRASRVGDRSRDGRVTYEWEVVEWTADDDGDDKMDDDDDDDGGGRPGPSKRLKHDGDGGGDAGSAEAAQPQ